MGSGAEIGTTVRYSSEYIGLSEKTNRTGILQPFVMEDHPFRSPRSTTFP